MSDKHGLFMKGLVLVFFMLFFCVSCMTVGNKFDPQSVNQLIPNVSTLDDATRLMGPPMAQTALPNGNTLYQWQYSQGTAIGTGSAAHVAIIFNPDGIMLKVHHKSSTSIN
jgi:hypothetical protein